MGECFYIIKNIKGGKDIKFPAFETLKSGDKTLRDILRKQENLKENLIQHIKSKVNLHHKTLEKVINNFIISGDVFLDSSMDIEQQIDSIEEQLVENVNNEIKAGIDSSHFEKTLWKYINDKSSSNYGSKINDLISVLSAPHKISSSIDIFKDYPENAILTSLASTNFSDLFSTLKETIKNKKDFNEDTYFEEELAIFLRTIQNNGIFDDATNFLLVEENSGISGINWNYKEESDKGIQEFFIVRKDIENKNLFLSIFKKIAGETPELNEVLLKLNNISKNRGIYGKIVALVKDSKNVNKEEIIYNGDIWRFFNSSSPEEFSTFDALRKLLEMDEVSEKVKIQIREAFNSISEILANKLKRNTSEATIKSFKKTIDTLLWQINPNLFGSERLKLKLLEIEKLNNSLNEANKLWLNETIKELNELKATQTKEDQTGEIFEKSRVIKASDNKYGKTKKNIVIGKDLVKLPLEKDGKLEVSSPYWVVTAIYPQNDGKIKILGARINQFGAFEKRSYIFDTEEEITYRKRNPDMVKPYEKDAVIEEVQENTGYTITFEDDIPIDIAKKILSIGDKVGNYLVVGVYPGYFLVKTPEDKIIKKFYKSNKEKKNPRKQIVLSKSIKEIIDEQEKYNVTKEKLGVDTPIQNISAGDYIKTDDNEYYNKVLFRSDDTIWYVRKDAKNNYIVKNINIKNVDKAVSSVEITTAKKLLELQKKLSTELDKIGATEATLSSFKDPNLAKNGDYIVFKSNTGMVYGVITDIDNNIATINNANIITKININENQDITYFSENNYLNDNFSYNLLANFWDVELLKLDDPKIKSGNYDKVEYITNEETFELIPGSIRPTNGKFDTSSKNLNQTNTLELLKVLVKDKYNEYGLFLEKAKNTKLYKRSIEKAGLKRIFNFEKIDSEFIEEECIFPGVYFSIYNKESIDQDIYRIEKVNKEEGTVYARLHKLNPKGNIIMTEKIFKISDLVAKSSTGKQPSGSIATYYLQNGNNKFSKITNEANRHIKETKESELLEKKIKHLREVLNTSFEKIGISVSTEENYEFSNGQKAVWTLNEEGRTSIILNKDFGKKEDLVHEGLHVFLTALRYYNPEIYNTVLKELLSNDEYNSDMSLLEKEELLVEKINNSINNFFTDDLFLGGKLSVFLTALEEAVKDITSNEDFTLQGKKNRSTITSILSQPIVEFIGIDINNKPNHPMQDKNLAQMEPMFRRWMETKNIQLKCD